MKWFKHDSNASLDAKLQRLRLKYGMEGYGLYWFCLEAIARNVEAHNLTFELEEDAELISAATNIHHERVEEMMLFMVNMGLFEESGGRITCLKMASRTDEYTQKLIRDSSDVPTISRHTPKKVPLNRIEQNRKEYIYPTLDEVKAHWKDKGWTDSDPVAFFEWASEGGWKDSKGRKITAWKRNAATWNNNKFGQGARKSTAGESFYV